MKNELEFLEYLQKELDELEYGEGVSYNLTFLNRDIEDRKSKLKNNGDLGDVSQAKRTVCPDCGDTGELRDEQERVIGTCPCHY